MLTTFTQLVKWFEIWFRVMRPVELENVSHFIGEHKFLLILE